MFEHVDAPLLLHKKTKKNFLSKYANFFLFLCATLVLLTLALAKTRREMPVGDVNAYRRAKDSIPSPLGDESDVAQEVEIGDILVATTESERLLCKKLRAFTGDLSGVHESEPLFGEELEYHNKRVKLKKGNYLYTKDGSLASFVEISSGQWEKKSGAPAEWEYGQILGRVTHKDIGTLITIEGESQTRVEAFTAPLSTNNKTMWACAYELLARLRSSQKKDVTLEEAITTLLTNLYPSGNCKAMEDKLLIEYALRDDGGKAAYNINKEVSQLNFGVPIALFDPMKVGSTAEDSSYDNDEKRHQFYKRRIPDTLKGLWPLNRLSTIAHRDDLAKLQLIQNPTVRSLAAFWREIHLTLLETERKVEDNNDKWKKGDFRLFPKHKFAGSEKIFTAASGAYEALFPGEKYVVGHMFKEGPFTSVDPDFLSTADGGEAILKDPWKGIRMNYDDEGDEKSIDVAQYGGQLFIVVETRGKAPIKKLLPSTKNANVDFEPLMNNFLNAVKEIQSLTSNVQSRCDEKPGEEIEDF